MDWTIVGYVALVLVLLMLGFMFFKRQNGMMPTSAGGAKLAAAIADDADEPADENG